MNPEERLAHLLDDDRWNGPGFVGRGASPREGHPLRRVLLTVAAGLLVGAVVTAGITAIRGAHDAAPVAVPSDTATTSPAAPSTETSVATTLPPSVALNQSLEVPKNLAALVAAASRSKPLAVWTAGRATFTIVLWPNGCLATPTSLERDDDTTIAVTFTPPPAGERCPAVTGPAVFVFAVPNGVATAGAVSVEVTSASGIATVPVRNNPADPSAPNCTVAQVTARVSASGSAGGSLYQDLVVTNTSATSCTLAGFPTISFRTDTGRRIGSVATYDPWGTPELVSLEPHGGTAAVRLKLANAANFVDQCAGETASGVRIVLPGASGSLFASWPARVCTAPGSNQFGASDVLAQRSTKNVGWQN